MAKEQGIDLPITSISDSWEGYCGSRVEEYLKASLQSLVATKIGKYDLVVSSDGEASLRAFASQETYDKWAKLDPGTTEAAALVLTSVSFRVAAASTDYTLATRITQNPSADMHKGAANVVKFTYGSYYGGDTSDPDTLAGRVAVSVNGLDVPELAMSLPTSGREYSLDLGPYLVEETNNVKITVANARGKSRTFDFEVRSIEIALSYDASFEEATPRTGPWALRVACRGVEALVHVELDGAEIGTATISNSTSDFLIDGDGEMSGGAHALSIWAENAQYGITTDPLRASFVKSGLSWPSVVFANTMPSSVPQYDTLEIPYFAYWGAKKGQTATVSFVIKDASGAVVETLPSQTVSFGADGSTGLQAARWVVTGSGAMSVTVGVGGQEATASFTAAAPDITLGAAGECKIFLTASGKTNADIDADDWHSEYGGERTCTVRRSSGFSLRSDNGFTSEGFLIRAGDSVTLDGFLPFAKDVGVNASNAADRTGRTIEFEFETRDCTDTSALIIDTVADGVGFRVYADRVELHTATAGNVNTIYCDNTRVRIGFVIDGSRTHCVNRVIGAPPEESYANVARIYINGVVSRQLDYADSAWKQNTPVPITIGSAGCDVLLHTVRVYDKALNTVEMMGNYAFDTPLLADKLEIARRNDIFDSARAVDFAKLLKARPDTPYKIWTMDGMPTKKDPVKCDTVFANPEWKAADGLARAPFTCLRHDVLLDGTSSLSYPDPYKNWGPDYSKGSSWKIDLPDGTTLDITSYSITPGMENGGKEFVDKVNFASSEGMFNIFAANLYQKVLLGAASSYPDLLTSKQAAQLAAGIPVHFRQSLEGFPETGWVRENGKTRFLSIFNFVNNKYDPSYFGFKNDGMDELWEVEDNVNFFSQHIDDGVFANGKWKDSATTLYYARVPKKSPATKQKYGVAGDATQTAQALAESAKLRRFHNWIYSCNPNIAERQRLKNGDYDALPAPVSYGSSTFTRDTPDYRRAKFAAEYGQYLNKSSAMFYFVFFNLLLGVDSMDKNMTIGFEHSDSGPSKAFFCQRDSDTLARYGNTGLLSFLIFHEWGDAYNPVSDQTVPLAGESYDADTDSFSPDLPSGFKPVFNGRLSGLWDLVSTVWAEDIKDMYGVMKGAGFNFSSMWELFTSLQGKWCEGLYNADAEGYTNTGRFDMSHGAKTEGMRHFLKYRSRYFDAKYGSRNQPLEFRLWGAGDGLLLRYSCPLYATMNWGAGGVQAVRVATPGEAALFPSTGQTFNETTVTVYDADLLTEMCAYTPDGAGGFTEEPLRQIARNLRVSGLDKCRLLKRLVLDYPASAPNTYLDNNVTAVGSSIALEELTITNCPGVTGAFSMRSTRLRTADLRGTRCTSFSTPPSDALTSVRLPGTIRSITFKSSPNLATLSLEDCAALQSVDVEGCPQLDLQPVVEAALNAGDTLANLRLRNVYWRDFPLAALEKLMAMDGCDITGDIALRAADIPDFDTKLRMIARFGNVDSAANPLRITYTARNLDAGGLSIEAPDYITKTGTYRFKVKSTPANANNVRSAVWAVDAGADGYATMDSQTGVLTVTRVIPDESLKPSATVSITVTLSDGTTQSGERTVAFYNRACKIGDWIYPDGTYTDVYDGGKTPIGVCFYINPDNPSERLMMSPKCMQTSSMAARECTWGLDHSYYNTNVSLDDDPAYDVYKVNGLVDVQATGNGGNYLTRENYLETDDATGESVFKSFPADTALGELGFTNATEPVGGWKRGDRVPKGALNTAYILRHANKIIDSIGSPLARPTDTADLEALMETAKTGMPVTIGVTYYAASYYYPAAYFCSLYRPVLKAGETLDARFEAGKWFLPSCGDMGRIMWYMSQSEGLPWGGYCPKNDNYFHTSTEASRSSYWFCSPSQGIFSGNKAQIFMLYPVCAF